MPAGAVLAVVAGVLVAAAIVVAFTLTREGGGPRLRRTFGPEYERTLARHEGDDRATRQELTERVRKYGSLALRPLDRESRERHERRWQGVQARFVDAPGAAVAEAVRLIGSLAAERGFPAPGSGEHFDALSVHHPHPVQGYRRAHALAGSAARGRRATEDLRRALVAARDLFDELLGAASPEAAPPEAAPPEAAPPEAAPHPDAAASPASGTATARTEPRSRPASRR